MIATHRHRTTGRCPSPVIGPEMGVGRRRPVPGQWMGRRRRLVAPLPCQPSHRLVYGWPPPQPRRRDVTGRGRGNSESGDDCAERSCECTALRDDARPAIQVRLLQVATYQDAAVTAPVQHGRASRRSVQGHVIVVCTSVIDGARASIHGATDGTSARQLDHPARGDERPTWPSSRGPSAGSVQYPSMWTDRSSCSAENRSRARPRARRSRQPRRLRRKRRSCRDRWRRAPRGPAHGQRTGSARVGLLMTSQGMPAAVSTCSRCAGR
jgi:hypothetical protein